MTVSPPGGLCDLSCERFSVATGLRIIRSSNVWQNCHNGVTKMQQEQNGNNQVLQYCHSVVHRQHNGVAILYQCGKNITERERVRVITICNENASQ